MATDIIEVVDGIPSPHSIKVHRVMCTDLIKLVQKVTKIFPDIEAARPRCLSGIKAFFSLKGAIDDAKLRLLDCCISSKLYMALNGIVMLSRCKKLTNLLEQNLNHIQNMVPVLLVAEISRIIGDVRAATFSLDPSEEEVGNTIRILIHQYASMKSVSKANIEFVAVRLQLTSQKAILTGKKSINKLLDEVGDCKHKKFILEFLLLILRNHENSIKKVHIVRVMSSMADLEIRRRVN